MKKTYGHTGGLKASQLAGLGWTETRVPPEEVQQARQIIRAYRRRRAGEAAQPAGTDQP